MNIVKKINDLFFTKVKVEWDDTNLNYTASGPRRTGTFTSNSVFRAHVWAFFWTIMHPRAAVYISKQGTQP